MVVNCCNFFYKVLRLCWQNWYYAVRCSTLYLFDLQISFTTIPQEARQGKSPGGTSTWASKRTLQASVLSVRCLQTNEKNRGTKCAFILIVVRPTVVRSSFDTEFLSFIRFSPLRLLWRRNQTGNFPVFSSRHEEELKLHVSLSTTKANYSDKNHWIKNSSLARLFCSPEITLTLCLTTGGEF